MFCLDDLNAEEIIFLASSISLAIAKGKTVDEIDLLGNFFSAIGQNLSTIAVSNFGAKSAEKCI